MKVSMLLLASGRGARLGAEVPKAYVELAGIPLVVRSARRLAMVTADREIVLAVQSSDREPYVEPIRAALEAAGVDHIVDGGDTRQASMENAFAASAGDAEVVLVHDAARPFFPLDATREAIRVAAEVGGAVLATRVADTLKQVDGDRIVQTVDRSQLWAAQTPQVTQRAALSAAIERARTDSFSATDDVSLLEHAGIPVRVIESSARNIKITTPDDLELGEFFAKQES